jgi:hypothetical protein
MEKAIIERFVKPNRLDTAPYGTVCKLENDGKIEHWIQVEPVPENGTAEWLPLGEFIIEALQGCALREDFILECLRLYADDSLLHESSLMHIMAKHIPGENDDNDGKDN